MLKLICSALALTVLTGSFPAGAGTPRFQSDPTPPQLETSNTAESSTSKKQAVEIPEEDAPEGELEPAAVQLDVTNTSPLIEELYRATRETKEKEILAHIEQAKQLVDKSDLKAVDSYGRTALHWAVFGSSYNIKPSVLVAYEEIADTLIQRGIDINKEDVYQDTALDYLLYSPSFEMQTLLIENGATSGFLVASIHYVSETLADDEAKVKTAALARRVDLMPGVTLSLRLSGPVYSDRSRTGDPIEATVTYPLCKNGENIACNEGELLVPPGTKVNGTILFAAKAPNKYSLPRVVLDFSNILHKNNQKSPLYARVIDVDNARETVRNNEILGIIQPHASTKASLVMAALGASNPIAGYTIKGVQTVYGLSIRREIMFPAGTDLQVQIVRPSILKQKEPWDAYRVLPLDAGLQHLVSTAPMRTAAKNKVLSDPTNLMFLGSRKQIIAAFEESGWIQASDLGVKSALKTAQATLRQTGYSDAPVSALLLQDRLPDLVFQKSLDTFAKRHHLRIWKLAQTYNGREVWVAAATHDIATTNSRAATKWSHRIDPHIDRERDWVESDLLFSGMAEAYVDVDRPKAPRKLENATGDDIVTDGKMSVVLLRGKATDENRPSPVLSARPTQ
jgi:LssY-like putative type I secretion system component LssY